MKRNLSGLDRIVRVLIFIIAAVLYLTNIITGTLGVIILLIGAALAITSFINWCPIYAAFGVSTCHKKHSNSK